MGIGLILLGLPFYFYWKKHRQDAASPPRADGAES
jgi:hypothetical protein